MTTYGWAMARKGYDEMLRDRSVMIAAICAVTFIVVCFLGALTYLAATGADSTTVLSLIATLVSVATLVLHVSTRAKVDTVVQQTNGQQTKLIDAAIAAPSPGQDRP